MAQTPSKPNPLHGSPKKEDNHKEVVMPGAPPHADMAPAEEKVDESHLSDSTMAEREAGRKQLSAQDERTKAEQAAGAAAISRHPQAKAPPKKEDDENDSDK